MLPLKTREVSAYASNATRLSYTLTECVVHAEYCLNHQPNKFVGFHCEVLPLVNEVPSYTVSLSNFTEKRKSQWRLWKHQKRNVQDVLQRRSELYYITNFHPCHHRPCRHHANLRHFHVKCTTAADLLTAQNLCLHDWLSLDSDLFLTWPNRKQRNEKREKRWDGMNRIW